MSLLKRLEQGQGDSGQSDSGKDASGGDGGKRLSSLQARRVSAPGADTQRDTYFDLKTRVQNRLLSELDPSMDVSKIADDQGTARAPLGIDHRGDY